MISAAKWIRKGVAKAQPDRFVLNESEYDRILSETQKQLSNATNDLNAAKKEKKDKLAKKEAKAVDDMEIDDVDAKYDMDNYDDEDTEEQKTDLLFCNKGLSFYSSNEEDPNIPVKDDALEEAEDMEDLIISPTDALIVAGSTKDDVSYIEVYVYEEAEDNLYVHHDVMIPSFPLCLEWLTLNGGGNFVALGSFESQIEIWNLDLIDAVYPHSILGSSKVSKNSSKGKKSSKTDKSSTSSDSHSDAVMCLSWNRNHLNILASGSADCTVKLWDLDNSKCLRDFTHHSGKVQTVQWNPFQSAVLATGAYDHTVQIFDSRTPQAVFSLSLNSDIECLKWNPFNESLLMTSDESGTLNYFDIRTKKPIAVISAHSHSATCIDFNPVAPNFLLSSSTDKTIKLWDLSSNQASCLVSKNVDQKVFTASFAEDMPYLVTVGGSKGLLTIWNLGESEKFRNALVNQNK